MYNRNVRNGIYLNEEIILHTSNSMSLSKLLKFYHFLGIVFYFCLVFSIFVYLKSEKNFNLSNLKQNFSSNQNSQKIRQLRTLNENLDSDVNDLSTQLNHFLNDLPLIESFLIENQRNRYKGKWYTTNNNFNHEEKEENEDKDRAKESVRVINPYHKSKNRIMKNIHEIDRDSFEFIADSSGDIRNEFDFLKILNKNFEEISFPNPITKNSIYRENATNKNLNSYDNEEKGTNSDANSDYKYDKNSNSKPDTKIYSDDDLDDPQSDLNILSDFHHSKEGEIKISLAVEKTQFTDKNLVLTYDIKDGRYKDKWINIKQIFPLFLYSNLNYNSLNFNFEFNEELNQYVTRLNIKKKMAYNTNILKMEMYAIQKNFLTTTDDLEIIFYNKSLSKIKGKIHFDDIGLTLYFKCRLDNSNLDKKISNFTLSLTFMGIIHLYHTLTLIKDILMTNLNPKSFSVSFLLFDINWNTILSIGHFYIATSLQDYFHSFAMPSIIYFINFSIFQIRLLFLVWKSQNLNLTDFEDENVLKKKMFKFYFGLYSSLMSGLVLFYFILSYKITLFLIVVMTFITQIIHNCNVNISRNKIPLKTIWIVTLNKIFFLLYFRMCPFNIFESKPDLTYVSLIISIVFLQIIFLYLQGKYGAKFFIPKSWRRGYFNYYKSYEEIRKIQNEIETMACAICLNNLILDETGLTRTTTSDFELESYDLIKIQTSHELLPSEKKCFTFLRKCRKNKSSSNLKLMVTPCKHIFHPECLKQWGEKKNECPVCRAVIPCIED